MRENISIKMSSYLEFEQLIEERNWVEDIDEIFEGSLIDNYFIFNGLKGFKYCMALERFKTAWTSELEVIFTDDIEFYEKTKELYR